MKKSYHTVNWWRGNLRPHESTTSLMARFANLNGITVRECEKYFATLISQGGISHSSKLSNVATSLDEDPAAMLETLARPVNLPQILYAVISAKEDDKGLRYCPECATRGYHSYLHDHVWLAACPLHGEPLKVAPEEIGYGPKRVRRCKSLTRIMIDSCASWPDAKDPSFNPESFEGFDWLDNWIKRLQTVPLLFRRKSLWSTDTQLFHEPKSSQHVIGRLHALVPIPEEKKRLFHYVEEGWGADIQYFPREAKQELEIVLNHGVAWLFSMYKTLNVYSSTQPDFVLKMKSYAHEFQAHEAVCRCEWGREKAGYEDHWVGVNPSLWPHWQLKCPYTVAREKMEHLVGRRLEFMTDRTRGKEMPHLMSDFKTLLELGLAEINTNSNLSDRASFVGVPDNWPPVSWIGTPWLNRMFESMANLEVASVHRSLCDWLDDIAKGGSPDEHTAPRPSIWLAEMNDGLVLLQWRRVSTQDAQPIRRNLL